MSDGAEAPIFPFSVEQELGDLLDHLSALVIIIAEMRNNDKQCLRLSTHWVEYYTLLCCLFGNRKCY